MMKKRYKKENILEIYILKRFFQNKHILLIGIGIREKLGLYNTVFDIEKAFGISKAYAWKLLSKLEMNRLIEKKGQIKRKENFYWNYKLTTEASDNLRILSSWLLNFNLSGEMINVREKSYYNIFFTKISSTSHRSEHVEAVID